MKNRGILKGLILPAALISLIGAGILASRFFREPAPFQRSEYLMGTIFDITVAASGDADLERLSSEAFSEIRRIEDLMSRYKEGSEVSAINRNAGVRPIRVSAEMMRILAKSREAAEMSEGAFDPTIGTLSALWAFDEEKNVIPSREEIEKAKGLVNYKRLVLNDKDSTAYLEDKGMMLDLGGIAKGYSLKAAMSVFERAEVRNVIINAGGNLNLRGLKGKKEWKIGIQHPRDEKRLLAVIKITDTSVSTSGDYQRYFMKDGARYHHILDPKTGYPAEGLVSVTILGRDETMTDALSTAAFVLGGEKGAALLRKTGAEWVMVDEKINISASEGLKGRLVMKDK